jgi:hypothetical protein
MIGTAGAVLWGCIPQEAAGLSSIFSLLYYQ